MAAALSHAFRFHPLTPRRWDDFARLFGTRGACGGCWCMAWRRGRAAFVAGKGAGNRRAMRGIVSKGEPPGVLAYAGKQVVGWCAIAPRQVYVTLERSRVLKPIDDQPVWSVSCFFVARGWRHKGLSTALLKAAVAFAKRRGAKIIEGYPVEPYSAKMPDVFAWTGLPGTFQSAGFVEAARRSKTRPIMRFTVR